MKYYRLIFEAKSGSEFESGFTKDYPKSASDIERYLRSFTKPWFLYPALWRLVEA